MNKYDVEIERYMARETHLRIMKQDKESYNRELKRKILYFFKKNQYTFHIAYDLIEYLKLEDKTK